MHSAFGKLIPTIPTIPTFVSPLLLRRHGYSATAPSTTASTVVAVKQELETIRSPRLVALEYADLNLTDKFSEVNLPKKINLFLVFFTVTRLILG